MITLKQLLTNISCKISAEDKLDLETPVTGIDSDSREICKGNIFVAIQGGGTDGHLFLEEAATNGCLAVVVERVAANLLLPGVIIIQVDDSNHSLGLLAAAFYCHPAREMTMIGITGTNGKTTTSWILEKILKANNYRVGIIGTVSCRFSDKTGKEIDRPASF